MPHLALRRQAVDDLRQQLRQLAQQVALRGSELLRELAAIRGEESPDGQVEAPHKSMFGRLRDAFQG